MKKSLSYILMLTYMVWSQNSAASNSAPSLEQWQMDMIYDPGEHVLEREQKGFVHIYDGFDETQVDRILDEKFERIDHMMFTRVKQTDRSGEILLDPQTGEALTEDDGCD